MQVVEQQFYNQNIRLWGGRSLPSSCRVKIWFSFSWGTDTWGSQRVMDTILSGTVPIFTHLNQYTISGHWIDWSRLSY
jgi:hypothetical protein